MTKEKEWQGFADMPLKNADKESDHPLSRGMAIAQEYGFSYEYFKCKLSLCLKFYNDGNYTFDYRRYLTDAGAKGIVHPCVWTKDYYKDDFNYENWLPLEEVVDIIAELLSKICEALLIVDFRLRLRYNPLKTKLLT